MRLAVGIRIIQSRDCKDSQIENTNPSYINQIVVYVPTNCELARGERAKDVGYCEMTRACERTAKHDWGSLNPNAWQLK